MTVISRALHAPGFNQLGEKLMSLPATASGIFSGIRGTVSAFVVILFTVMMTAVLVQIAGRYVFNYSISGASEVATFSQIWLVFFGAGVAMRRGQHVVVDILEFFLPDRVRKIASIVVAAGSIAFVLIVAWTSLALINIGFIQTSPALQLPMWMIYLCIPIGSLYLVLEIVAAAVQAPLDDHPLSTEVDV